MTIKPNCGQLTWKAKDVHSLLRQENNVELWGFVESWIHRFSETEDVNVAEKLIYLWVSVNAWASKSVPDMSRNHEDAYLVHCMAKDPSLSERFNDLYHLQDDFKKQVNDFISLAPVFQALWLQNNGIPNWNISNNRGDFVKYVMDNDPFIRSIRNGQEMSFPAFAPACAHDHLQTGITIPADWPHVLSMIYQVRCNLFHGGKNYSSESDRQFITLAYKILWGVWMKELPSRILRVGMSWRRILVRSGFIFNQQNQYFSFSGETQDNIKYLNEIIQFGNFGVLTGETFTPKNNDVDENLWLSAVDGCHSGVEGGSPDELLIMDACMAGLVRWLNRIGIKTTFSCDGHGRNLPRVELNNSTEARIAAWLLTATGINVHAQNKNLLISGRNSGPRIPSQQNFDRKQLLDIAEWLHDNMGALTETVKRMRLIPLPRLVNTPIQTSTHHSSPRHRR